MILIKVGVECGVGVKMGIFHLESEGKRIQERPGDLHYSEEHTERDHLR